MKIRSGFVSNSSSSSFIIGAVIVTDNVDEIRQQFPHNTKSLVDLMMEDSNQWWSGPSFKKGLNAVSIESFTGHEVRCKNVEDSVIKNPSAVLLYIDETGQEPTFDDNAWEYNYHEVDETEEWFTAEELKVASKIQELGGEVQVGGGYNG